MKIKKSRLFLYLIIIVILVSLILKTNLLYENISGLLSKNIIYYPLVILLGILLVILTYRINIYYVSKNFSLYMSVALLLGTISPYRKSGFISIVHEVIMYIAFFMVMIGIYYLLDKFSLKNYDLSLNLRKFYILLLFAMGLIYFSYLGVNSLMEMIFIGAILVIYFILESEML